MIFAWIRFCLVAVLLLFGLACFVSAVTGAWKFGFVLNRLHAAGIGDSLGLLFVVLAMIVYSGFGMEMLKLAALVLFLWMTSPISSHLLSQIEFYTNPSLYQHVEREPRSLPEAEEAAASLPGKE